VPRACGWPKHPSPPGRLEMAYDAVEAVDGRVPLSTAAARPNTVLEMRPDAICQALSHGDREASTRGQSLRTHRID